LLALLLGGCNPQDPAAAPQARPFEGQKLRLLVVDDPQLAGAAERFRGEWRARTGAEFEIGQRAAAEIAAGQALDADAAIYPAHLLGPLAESDRLVRVPKEVLADSQLAWQEIFELLRVSEATWGSDVYAIPFGSPVLVCYYRNDLLSRLNEKPPATWDDYQRLVQLLSDRSKLADAVPAEGPWSAALEPLGPGWAGQTLLARAAAYAKHPDYFSVLFNLETMAPLVDTPPFVKALEQLVAAAKQGPPEALEWGPDEVRDAFWRGECGLALSWPSASRGSESSKEKQTPQDVRTCALPGSTEVYNPQGRAWQPRGKAASVPLLSTSGRLGSVSKASGHAPAAFQLLIALSGPQWSSQVCAASPSATLFRQSHAKAPREWVERSLTPAAAQEYAELTEQTLSGHEALSAIPLPGRDEYLTALDNAVHAAVKGKATPTEALTRCAATWREITQRLGIDRQREAYRKSAVKQP
jgi:multiple sugar transport system substrate-binding protein